MNPSDEAYIIEEGTRLFQLCGPTLEPIEFTIVNVLSNTERVKVDLDRLIKIRVYVFEYHILFDHIITIEIYCIFIFFFFTLSKPYF